MSQYLTPRQGWELDTRAAARQGQPLPMPSDGPRLTAEQQRLWSSAVVQQIGQVQPIQTPAEWLAAQSPRREPEAQRRASWQALEAQRAAAARPDVPPLPSYGELSRSDFERMRAELEAYRGQ